MTPAIQRTAYESADISKDDKLTPYRDGLKKLLVAEGHEPQVAPHCFLVRDAAPSTEYLTPDFWLPKEKTYILLSNGISLPTKDQNRMAVLRGLYPEFKFIYLTKRDVNAVMQKIEPLSAFVGTFSTTIE